MHSSPALKAYVAPALEVLDLRQTRDSIDVHIEIDFPGLGS